MHKATRGRPALRVQTPDWRTFATVATYDQPMQAEADAFRLVETGYHVRVASWKSNAPFQDSLRLPGRSKVWTGAEHDWKTIGGAV